MKPVRSRFSDSSRRQPVLAMVLAVLTVPAIVAGLASEAAAVLARRPQDVSLTALIALPLAALLLLLAASDIISRRQEVRRLQARAAAADSRLEAVIASTVDAIILLGVDGTIGTWPPTAATLYGLSTAEARGQTFEILVVGVDAHRARVAFELVVGGGGRQATRAVHRGPDGATFIASATWTPVHDGQGALAGVSLSVHDVTGETLATARLEASERRARLLAESAIDAVISADEAGRVVGWNPAAQEMFHGGPAPQPEITLDDLLPAVDGGDGWHGLAGRVDRVIARRCDGSAFEVEASIATYLDDDRTWFTAFVRDVTERADAERRAVKGEATYRSVVETLPGVVYSAPVGRWAPLAYASPPLRDLLGYAPDDLVGTPGAWQELIHVDDRERVLADIEAGVASRQTTHPVREYRMVRRDGREIWVRDHSDLDVDADGNPVAWHGFVTDITERKQLEAELVRLAFHDPLTGLANRALLGDRVSNALARSERQPGLVAMFLIDLDDFKLVNDAHGHEVGDELLVAVGRRLRETARAGSTIARLGGDEFAILMDGLEDEAAAWTIAQRFVTALAAPLRVDAISLSARASVGVAVDINRRRSASWLMRAADLAMYEAKRLGKGRWRAYSPQAHLASTRRLVLESELHRAVQQGQFLLHYQPVRDMQTSQVVGTEALLRWNHPKRGIVAPAQFIELLEYTGLINEVGRWVVDEACRQAAKWQSQIPTLQWTAVNVSAVQLRSSTFVPYIADTLQRHGLDAGRLSIEITESLALDDSADTDHLLRRLRELGVRIAVDDFGTGYSSLSYLRRLPIDRIKIDRTFVEGVGSDPEATAVVRVIVELARSLRLSTVAEGIEHELQARTLSELGCDLGQGFLLGRPMGADAIGALVKAQQAGVPRAKAG